MMQAVRAWPVTVRLSRALYPPGGSGCRMTNRCWEVVVGENPASARGGAHEP